MFVLEKDVRGSSGASSCPSVDTDAESGLDDLVVAATEPVSAPDAGASDLEDPDGGEREARPGAAAEERGPRHPAGTWVIWSNTWCYITKTPPWKDVKCNIRHALRNEAGGVGTRELSKTLTPAHY